LIVPRTEEIRLQLEACARVKQGFCDGLIGGLARFTE
jgi:hypothetical protein